MTAPRKSPCATCPYRRNVPSGIWDPEEYAKLPAYDEETFAQPPTLFMCHQGEGDVCAGWFAHKDPWDLLAVRLAVLNEQMRAEHPAEYETNVPLFSSGREAAEHGLRDVLDPDERAQSAMSKIIKKRSLPTSQNHSEE